MKREVQAGVDFLKRLAVARGSLDEAKADVFAEKLHKLLCNKYEEHWYPDQPSRGQAYRCLHVSGGRIQEEMLLKACEQSELTPDQLGRLPNITLWIDPLEVCARAGENSRPFTIASFKDEDEEEDARGEEDSSVNLDTSDYHSASSDCSSTASSDTEEEAKDDEKEAEKTTEGGAYNVVMVPRIRKRRGDTQNKVKYFRNMIPANLQYFYPPTPAWSQYKKSGSMFLNTVCVPPPPPPPPPQHIFGYYILSPQPSPQFIVPQASLQPWAAVKG